MPKSKFNTKYFFKKLRFRYRFSIMNESTLGEIWFAHLSRLRVFLLTFLLLVILFALNTFLLIKTPLKRFTPGFLDRELQSELIYKSLKLDSLQADVDKQKEYIDAVKNLMAGNIVVDSLVTDADSLLPINKTFIEKSAAEKAFSENFEKENEYDLSPTETLPVAKELVNFSPPVEGLIAEKFQQRHHYGIDINTAANERVVSVAEGTIVFTAFTIDDGYVIQVQHNNNYLSTYKCNAALLKKQGDRVKSGETIAVVATDEATQKSHLHFELWHEGMPLNPESYIVF